MAFGNQVANQIGDRLGLAGSGWSLDGQDIDTGGRLGNFTLGPIRWKREPQRVSAVCSILKREVYRVELGRSLSGNISDDLMVSR